MESDKNILFTCDTLVVFLNFVWSSVEIFFTYIFMLYSFSKFYLNELKLQKLLYKVSKLELGLLSSSKI